MNGARTMAAISRTPRLLPGWALALSLALLFVPREGAAQVFSNLLDYVIQLRVGDPKVAAAHSLEGPKGIATADFDGDGIPDLAVSNSDGTVTVYYGLGNGRFTGPFHLRTGGADLRGIACADWNGDARPDIAAVSPFDGNIYLFLNEGSRRFASVTNLAAWPGARNLVAGDFDGDGVQDLVVAGTTNGVRQYRGLGNGRFAVVTSLLDLAAPNDPGRFPKPVFSLKTLRLGDSASDALVVTHAQTPRFWVLGCNESGALEAQGSFVNLEPAQSFDAAPILAPAAVGMPDLVTVHTDDGTVDIHSGIGPAVCQTLDIPGGPRAVHIVDLDGDGWNDLVVVVRNADIVLTYRNRAGVLEPASERPVGISPRELAVADFNGDGYPDVAVMNHDSQDVSILLTYPQEAGFTAVDHMYLVDGDVVGLAVLDFNHDGRDDVIQLHRASGDFSVRLAGPEGVLAPPVFYTIGNIPASQVIVDVNNDRISDQVTANLGLSGIEPGSVSVRLGRGDGTFGEERRYYLPPGKEGRLYALVPGDFDGDGCVDLAAGYLDGRIAFFRGAGDGTFTFTREHPLLYAAQELVAGDFDQDGDLDLAAVGITGEVVVIENRGDLLNATALTLQFFSPPRAEDFGARTLKAVDLNHDGDLDLIIGSGNKALLYFGAPGMGFSLQSTNLGGIDFPVSSMVEADFDGDGKKELVLANKSRNSLTVLAPGATTTNFVPVLVADVPASKFLATGDLDGDGLPDLVGTGNILWTALSGQRPQLCPPLRPQGQRQGITSAPLINEILAHNTRLPVAADEGRTAACVELYNGMPRSMSLSGWRLRLTQDGAAGRITNEFAFPATAFFGSDAHLLVIFSETRRTLYHTGFGLPNGGATLALINSDGEEVDHVAYPAQLENVSYARYRDGLPAFVFNPYPSPGRANTDNGRLAPDVTFDGADPATFRPGQPIRFYATASRAAGVAGVSLLLQRLDNWNSPAQRVVLYDDGQHGDGAASDGQFAGVLEAGLPAGAQFQYYLEVVDLDQQAFTIPDDPVFGRPGQPGNLDSLAIGFETPPVELSEVVPFNVASLLDEFGGTPDWVEIRNRSANPVQLGGISLSQQLGDGSRYYFPTNLALMPGEHRLVYCDGNSSQGPFHAPFNLKRSGEQLLLSGTTTNGARTLIDWVAFGALAPDTAWARLGCGGTWVAATPTPGAQNVANGWLGLVQTNGATTVFTLAFPTTTNQTYTVQYSPTLNPPAWTSLPPIPGDGIEKIVTLPFGNSCFYRVRVGN